MFQKFIKLSFLLGYVVQRYSEYRKPGPPLEGDRWIVYIPSIGPFLFCRLVSGVCPWKADQNYSGDKLEKGSSGNYHSGTYISISCRRIFQTRQQKDKNTPFISSQDRGVTASSVRFGRRLVGSRVGCCSIAE